MWQWLALTWLLLLLVIRRRRARSNKSTCKCQRLRKNCAERPASVCCTCIVAFSLLVGLVYLGVALNETANRAFEFAFMKRGFIHDFFQTSKGQTNLPPSRDLIVFQHIPRTAGDASRTHLFNDIALDRTPLWPKKKVREDVWELDPDVPVLPWVDSPRNTRKDFSDFESGGTKMVKGYFSRDDLTQVQRKMRIFTILRHPVERVLSFYKFSHRRVSAQLGRDDYSFEDYFDEKKAKDAYLEAYLDTYVKNTMTYQLGCYMHGAHRKHCPPEVALERAKQWVGNMTYVAFFENYMYDFWELRRLIFSEVDVPEVFPALFSLGLWLSYPKLRIKSYSDDVTPEQLKMLEAYTDLDMQLYAFAYKRFSKSFFLYDSFGHFLAWNGPLLLLAVALCAGLCCGSVWVCDRRCGSRKIAYAAARGRDLDV